MLRGCAKGVVKCASDVLIGKSDDRALSWKKLARRNGRKTL